LLDLGILGIAPLALAVIWAFPPGDMGPGNIRPAFAGLYAAFVVASFVNPSLQEISYPMVVLGTLVLLSGHIRSTRIHAGIDRHPSALAGPVIPEFGGQSPLLTEGQAPLADPDRSASARRRL